MMLLTKQELEVTLKQLLKSPEKEWIEFKEAKSNFDFNDLGEYFSAISNEANLKGRQYGWLIFGISNNREIVGTKYRSERTSLDNLKKEIADKTNERITFIEIYDIDMNSKRIIMFQIPAAVSGVPTSWRGHYYGRDNESNTPLSLHEMELIRVGGIQDWSKQICHGATIDNLDKKAISVARERFKQKNTGRPISQEIDGMSDLEFLNKAKLTTNGEITHTALLLLGNSDSDMFFDGYLPTITWKLQNTSGTIKDYEHFSIPFILAVDDVFSKIRNLRYRYMTLQMSLFPNEVDQYDPYIIREILHNCIAHQDYFLKGRINIIEFEDKLMFINEGSFIPGRIEDLLEEGYVPPYYRNGFLANAMVNLNMIDTVGSGIKRVFAIQREKYFPLPDYDLNEKDRVKVTVYGKIIDENYTKQLFRNTDLDIDTVLLLDKVQKGYRITKQQCEVLRKQKLIEGRYPNLFVSFKLAEATEQKVKYIHNKGVGDDYLKELILKYIDKYGVATRTEIDDLIYPKLPDSLDEKNKESRIRYIINMMSTKEHSIKNIGNRHNSRWVKDKND